MLRDIVVGIAESDSKHGTLLVRYLETLGFDVRQAQTVRQALDLVQRADILSLDWSINTDGPKPDVVMDEWVSQKNGPLIVIAEGVTTELRDDLLCRGAYNVLGKPVPMHVYQSVMLRFGREVLDRKALAELRDKVSKLECEMSKRKKRDTVIRVVMIGGALLAGLIGGGVQHLPGIIAAIANVF